METMEKKVDSAPVVVFYDPGQSQWVSLIKSMTNEKFPFSKTFDVTPEWAQQVMDERNTDNRRLDKNRVKRYALDMVRDKWKINNDDICFLESGILLNGQHRLKAVIESKRTIKMSFKFGLTDDVIPTVDEGKSRTNLDILRIMHQPGTQKTISATNYLMEQKGHKSSCPRMDVLDFYKKHFDAAVFACQLSRPPYSRNPVHAALIRAYYNEDHGRLLEFINIVNDGSWDKDKLGDEAAIRLRLFIEAHRNAHTGPGRTILYLKTQNAIKRFCEHLATARLYAATENLYLLPEETLLG